ncbi:MAG: hypothetical protein DCC43_00285 [Candidatus Brocadia sp.]|nr:hypothetical protein [Candidatus Brocadia sp. AMX3]RIK03465.1 MAG: hypothetical protein DCC43_00285 [Candidatus Brocadia sp.]
MSLPHMIYSIIAIILLHEIALIEQKQTEICRQSTLISKHIFYDRGRFETVPLHGMRIKWLL